MEILVLDAIRDQRHWVPVDPDQSIGALRDDLVSRFSLPTLDFTGQPVEYWLERLSDGQRLDPEQTLADAGIEERDTLELVSPAGKEVYAALVEVFSRIEAELKQRAKESFDAAWKRVLERVENDRPEMARQVRSWLQQDRLPSDIQLWADQMAGERRAGLATRILQSAACRCSLAALATASILAIALGGVGGLIAEHEGNFIGEEPQGPVVVDNGPVLTAIAEVGSALATQIAAVPPPTVAPPATDTPVPPTEEALEAPTLTLLVGDDASTSPEFRQALRAVFPWYSVGIGIYEYDAGGETEPVPPGDADPLAAAEVLSEFGELVLFAPLEDPELVSVTNLVASYLTELGVPVVIEGVDPEFIVDAWIDDREGNPGLLALIPRRISPE